jgi:prophage regulatory protein
MNAEPFEPAFPNVYADDDREGRIMNIKEVVTRVGLSASTIHRLKRKGRFPKPIRLSDFRVGYREREVSAWLASRPVK